MWFLESSSSLPRYAVNLSYDYRSMANSDVTHVWLGVHPSFVIDLSKVDATVVDTVKYK